MMASVLQSRIMLMQLRLKEIEFLQLLLRFLSITKLLWFRHGIVQNSIFLCGSNARKTKRIFAASTPEKQCGPNSRKPMRLFAAPAPEKNAALYGSSSAIRLFKSIPIVVLLCRILAVE
jgi:hypothetical protein